VYKSATKADNNDK